jgi:molybdopterin synthase catalytic subunit/molybdopterin converting factor small subunit
MRIRVLFFGALRDRVSPAEQVLELGPSATAAAVLDHYRIAAPGALWNTVAIAVNQQYADPGVRLYDGDEVALLPPVSGGLDPLSIPAQVWLTREPIDSAKILDGIKAGADGAVVLFDGIARNNTRGRETLFLDYEGYEAMALGQMRTLAADALERFPVREIALVHRLGRLSIGESSVLVAVASAHRGAAFDACRWLIDTLKKTVPIWKKEHFIDGAVWADGELFPPEIAAFPPAPAGQQL